MVEYNTSTKIMAESLGRVKKSSQTLVNNSDSTFKDLKTGKDALDDFYSQSQNYVQDASDGTDNVNDFTIFQF